MRNGANMPFFDAEGFGLLAEPDRGRVPLVRAQNGKDYLSFEPDDRKGSLVFYYETNRTFAGAGQFISDLNMIVWLNYEKLPWTSGLTPSEAREALIAKIARQLENEPDYFILPDFLLRKEDVFRDFTMENFLPLDAAFDGFRCRFRAIMPYPC